MLLVEADDSEQPLKGDATPGRESQPCNIRPTVHVNLPDSVVNEASSRNRATEEMMAAPVMLRQSLTCRRSLASQAAAATPSAPLQPGGKHQDITSTTSAMNSYSCLPESQAHYTGKIDSARAG